MLSPFFLKPSRAATFSSLLRISATAVILASLTAWLLGFVPDLLVSYRWAGPSVFTEVDRRQMAAVRQAIPEGETLLLIAPRTDVWHARLWQRGLYPRNQVVVVLDPFDAASIRALRERYSMRHAVLLGPAAFDPGLLSRRDLGPLPGLSDRVFFGELAP